MVKVLTIIAFLFIVLFILGVIVAIVGIHRAPIEKTDKEP